MDRGYPICRFCGSPLEHVYWYNQFVCHTCRTYRPPSEHGPIYWQPPRPPRLRLDRALGVLTNPIRTFRELWPETDLSQGLWMYVLVTMFIMILNYLPMFVWGQGMPIGYTEYEAVILGYILLIAVVSFVVGIAMFYFLGYLTAAISRSFGRGYGDVRKTVGLLGYAEVVRIPFALATFALAAAYQPSAGDVDILGTYVLASFMISIIGFIITLIVGGGAVSVANNISHGMGILIYFLSVILVAIIVAAIMFAVMFGVIFTLA